MIRFVYGPATGPLEVPVNRTAAIALSGAISALAFQYILKALTR